MADSDPITQFFSAKEAESPDILYTTLSLQKSATAEEVRKAYRKQALKYHPDKHASKSEREKEELGKEFQKVGFAYAVLSDEKKRKRYDSTGRTDENAFSDAEEMGWEAYFASLFERVDRKMLDDHKKKYQGSEDEKDDVIEAYNSSKGNLASILDSIPHAGIDDEERLVTLINSLIQDGTLASNKKWASTSVDQGAKAKRAKSARKEAAEAEKSAKELGVWDEFYGEGKKGKRKADEANGAGEKNDSGESKGKGKGKRSKEDGEEEQENLGGLQALIQKRQQARGSFLDGMAEKYAKIESDSKAKKRKGKKGQQVEEGDGEEGGGPPDISDADFEALQAKMFNKKGAGKGKAK